MDYDLAWERTLMSMSMSYKLFKKVLRGMRRPVWRYGSSTVGRTGSWSEEPACHSVQPNGGVPAQRCQRPAHRRPWNRLCRCRGHSQKQLRPPCKGSADFTVLSIWLAQQWRADQNQSARIVLIRPFASQPLVIIRDVHTHLYYI